MKLYHLSFDLDAPLTRTFWPRVPKCKMAGENYLVPRVCFSRSVIGCINAIPDENLFLDPEWGSGDYRCQAVLFSIDSMDISPSMFIGSQELYEQGLVPDAIVNQECWCLEPVQMTGEIVDVRMVSHCRNDILFCAKERDRDFIYSLIDRFCDQYASKNIETLDSLSLFYIMNAYIRGVGLPYKSVVDLEDEFFSLARSVNGPDLIDAYDVYTHVRVDGRIHCVDEHFIWIERKRKSWLDDLIYSAESQAGIFEDILPTKVQGLLVR